MLKNGVQQSNFSGTEKGEKGVCVQLLHHENT